MKKGFTLFIVTAFAIFPFMYSMGRNQAEILQANQFDKTRLAAAPSLAKIIGPAFDTADYNKRMRELSNGDSSGKWPVKAPYPLNGALLPYNRIIAYYGNLYSKKMGILGELPKKQVLAKLRGEVKRWQAADSSVTTIPALHYIAVTAQGLPGPDKKHRQRMPFQQIDIVLKWAAEINALVFVDIQTGHSAVKDEVQRLKKYLVLPNVHLAIDPEFSLKSGEIPGTKIGSFSAEDINVVVDWLAEAVRKHKLPPKILVVHRFTGGMIRGFDKIKKLPEVQLVIDMDGFGDKHSKRKSYLRYIYNEPVQFAGVKLFYKNDRRADATGLYTPQELLKFTPKPVYIQYQ